MRSITLTPRYGRDYKSAAEVKEAFDANNDFTVFDMSSRWDGTVANKSDLAADGVEIARIRYQRLTKVVNIEVTQ